MMSFANSVNSNFPTPLKIGGLSQEFRASNVTIDIGSGKSDTVLYTIPGYDNFVVTKIVAYNTTGNLTTSPASFTVGVLSSGVFTPVTDLVDVSGLQFSKNYIQVQTISGAVAGLYQDQIIARPSAGTGSYTLSVTLFGYNLA